MTNLLGPALSREVELRVFGDDLGCGENRERIFRALNRHVSPNSTLGYGVWHRKAYLPNYEPTIEFETPVGVRGADWLWENRAGKPWQSALEQYIASCRTIPRPFHRDLVLAMGLLDCDYQIEHERDRGLVTAWVGGPGPMVMGQARYAEFPDAKDDDERRVLATCAAICRAVLRAKEDANG